MADSGRPATLQAGQLTGVWAAIHKRRDRLEQHATDQVLAAWRDLTAGLDLATVVTVLRQQVGPAEADVATDRRRHVREVLAAAVLAQLAALTRQPAWPTLIAALTGAMRTGRAAGASAGAAVVDDTELPDNEDGEDDEGDPDEDLAAAYTVTASAMRGTAQDIARALQTSAEQGDDEPQMHDLVDTLLNAGTAWALATATASAAAFMDGLVGAYLDRMVPRVEVVTVGDGRVCQACMVAEDGSPYTTIAAPRPPLHPYCRCIVQPTT